jgi:alpha-D-ribose 1-methylphosphonate 5-triphosphate synthase subunit PhnH
MIARIEMERITPGFLAPVFDSQQSFRAILDAMIHPGTQVLLPAELTPPVPLNPASAAACLSLMDFETSFWSDLDERTAVVDWLSFHCGCRIVSKTDDALFALIIDAGSLPPLSNFRIGTDACPDTSTTVIVQVNGFSVQNGKRLKGPGIQSYRKLGVKGLPEDFWNQWQAQFDIFPLGVDILFTFGNRLIALPRSTMAEG